MLRINAFPESGDLWRVDWFGHIAFPNRMMRRRHPSVLVSLSKSNGPDTAARLSLSSLVQTERKSTQCWVSVGTTMLLRIGDLWREQSLESRAADEELLCEDLAISRDTCELVKAGSSFEDGSFMLPLHEHAGHRENTHSYCVRVALPDGKLLVVQCMELIRFYFGSSSELLNRLFVPPIQRENLYTGMTIDRHNRMTLQLADRIPRASAEDIARIAGSRLAWRAAAMISTSCVSAAQLRQEIYPQTLFPFEGTTTLRAAGKWLSRGNDPKGTFLVYQLLSCSHPFPFKSLRFRVTGAKKARSSSLAPEAPPQEGTPTARKAQEPSKICLEEHDPSSQLAPATMPVRANRRFVDLENKWVFADRTIAGKKPRASASSGDPISEHAIGEPGSTKRIREAQIVEGDNEVPDPPAFLEHAVKALSTLDDASVRVLTASRDDGWSVPVPLIMDEDGVLDEHILVPEDMHRLKRVAAFAVSSKEASTLLMVHEASPPVSFAIPLENKSEEAIQRAIQAATGAFISVQNGTAYQVMALEHTQANAPDELRSWISMQLNHAAIAYLR
ncbi:hypothetical protein CJO79_03610 [Ralstonia solanacearum]|nr:hypothetical protein CJO76_03620 [Ralstonia solanacearum]AXV92487.1 hypothetical protein CJO79_03610 [Ralstonia solanacearum]AXW20539.1 hypothetical protein CJO85_03655 [Ralstonia solanacearum]AXW77379.1 hypothetical protein CJO97_03620 [Ralstonia solanacearum]